MGARSEHKTIATLSARRRWLTQVTALASSTALPLTVSDARAQSASTPENPARIALVIGNADYMQAPLINPASDAQAIGSTLRHIGFQVDVRLNAGRIQLRDAIQRFSGELAKTRGIGFFYYAGHGAQHAWRNYLIPVDAAVARIDEVRNQAVELNWLVQTLIGAGNARNVIVLDACRESPFGNTVRIAQKGLAQFDAPAGTLLAYAARPDQTVEDNNRYAANLLREMAVADTPIEDVFKRIQVALHSESDGRQAPWQSAALAEKLYLHPSQQVTQLSRRERERQFEQELAAWQATGDAASVENYLRCHPSGKFCELGHFRLERLLTIKERTLAPAVTAGLAFAAVAPNPFSKGTLRADAKFRPGDSYSYRKLNAISRGAQGRFTETVTAVTDTDVIFDHGERVIDLLGNDLKSRIAKFPSPAQFYPAEYAIGRQWATRFNWGNKGPVEISLRIVRKETITVAAGTFDTFRIEGQGERLGFGGGTWKKTVWMAPEICRRPVAMESVVTNGSHHVVADRYELTRFRQIISPATAGHGLQAQMAQGLALGRRKIAA